MNIFLDWLALQFKDEIKTTPLYIQLASHIENAMQINILKKGDFLPPERLLAETLNLSRVTISKALGLLENKNLIIRTRGLGTQAVFSPLIYSLNEAKGFTAQATKKGNQVNNIWLKREIVQASLQIAQNLQLDNNALVSHLSRIRQINGIAVSFESTWIPLHFLPDPLQVNHSLYTFWQTKNIVPHTIEYHMHAVLSSQELSQHLNIHQNKPLLLVKQTTSTKELERLEYSESFCRSDLYDFKVTVS